MFIYNVTTKVANNIAEAWLQWMQEEQIPEMTGTGCFTHATILRLLEIDDSEGPTYAMQFRTDSKEQYELYLANYADRLREKSFEKWGNQFISFKSFMHIVQ